MYSRDVFPKYSSGGLPIPENYSGNAIRRTPPRQSPPPRPVTPQGGSPRTSVPLTVSSSFAARQRPPATAQEQESPIPPAPSADSIERAEREERRESENERQTEPRESQTEEKEETTAVSATPPHARDNGFSSLLSSFLPPKPDGGLLSHIGLEEALLLGLFLLLSQSEEDEDTLMLLALLFLYR